MKRNEIYFSIILFLLVLLSFIFIPKTIYLAPKLNISVGVLIYPFTFLVLVLMFKKNNVNYVKESLGATVILLLVFYLLLTILNSIDSVVSSQFISDSLRNVFTPNHLTVGNTFIYYPNIMLLFTYSLVFFITHYIFITIYEAIEGITNYPIAFILAILISFILDQLLFTPLSSLPLLIDKGMNYKQLIELMTANFIIVIFTSVIMLFIYAIAYKKVQ